MTLQRALGLGCFLALVSCGADTPRFPHFQEEKSKVASVQRDANGQFLFVDTHDNYGHTGVVNLSSFTYFKKKSHKPALALTFDCAWVDEANGMEILDVLKAQGIQTTFFISGPFIFVNQKKGLAGGLKKASYKMIKRMVEDGHEFGNHTITHPHNASAIAWDREVSDLEGGWKALLKDIYGENGTPANARMLSIWRAPYGEYDKRSLTLAARAGYPYHFGWNVDVKDSVGFASCAVDPQNANCLSPQKMTRSILDFSAKNQDKLPAFVILAHLQNPYNWGKDPQGLQTLISTVRARGLEFAKVSEIFVPPAGAPPIMAR